MLRTIINWEYLLMNAKHNDYWIFRKINNDYLEKSSMKAIAKNIY